MKSVRSDRNFWTQITHPSVLIQFNGKLSEKSNEEDDYILPPDFYEIKKLILIEVPYCEKNETSSKHFLQKFHELTNDSYEIQIKWIIKMMTILFRLKSKNLHPACAIYQGICTYKENYIGETKQNVEIRWVEHSDINKISEPSRYLKANSMHAFTWEYLITAPFSNQVRRNL